MCGRTNFFCSQRAFDFDSSLCVVAGDEVRSSLTHVCLQLLLMVGHRPGSLKPLNMGHNWIE